MRSLIPALAGVAIAALTPMSAFALPTGFAHPTQAQITEARMHRNPCNSVGNSPHELAALQAMQDRCRRLKAQLAAHPGDAALREACDHAAHALTGQPC